jgi:hypothetical protein
MQKRRFDAEGGLHQNAACREMTLNQSDSCANGSESVRLILMQPFLLQLFLTQSSGIDLL